jgi:protein TonB
MIVEYLVNEKHREEPTYTGSSRSPVQEPKPTQIIAGSAESAPVTVPRQTPETEDIFPKNSSDTAVPKAATSSVAPGTTVAPGASTGNQEGVNLRNSASPLQVSEMSIRHRSEYRALLKRLIEAHKEYPLAARKAGREGGCQRRFVVSRTGRLTRVETVSSCGHAFLDEAATRAITAVGQFPPLPDEFKGSEETFMITMTFTLAR